MITTRFVNSKGYKMSNLENQEREAINKANECLASEVDQETKDFNRVLLNILSGEILPSDFGVWLECEKLKTDNPFEMSNDKEFSNVILLMRTHKDEAAKQALFDLFERFIREQSKYLESE